MRPLSGSSSVGPAYCLELAGQPWDLWFEAAGIWDYYDVPSPYQKLMGPALGHPGTPLGADILLIAPGKASHAFECKFGTVGYIAREGYIQACTYAHELRRYLTPDVTCHVVAPDPKVIDRGELYLEDLVIGVMGPRHLGSVPIGS